MKLISESKIFKSDFNRYTDGIYYRDSGQVQLISSSDLRSLQIFY